MTEAQAAYIPCPNYLSWWDAPYPLEDSTCFYLEVGGPDCELPPEDSEHGGKKCPFAVKAGWL